MNDRSTRQQKAFRNLGKFISDNPTDFSPGSAVPGYGTSLLAIADQMDEAGAGQLGGSGGDVTAGLLGALQTDLQLIGGIARAHDVDHPGLAGKFPTVGTTASSITTTADAYLKQLEANPGDTPAEAAAKTALVAIFTSNEMPADFVANLRADRDAITPAILDAATKAEGKVQSTASVTILSHQGMEIRAKAVTALRARYSRQSDKLRAAESAAHIERAPQRAKAANSTGGTAGTGGGK